MCTQQAHIALIFVFLWSAFHMAAQRFEVWIADLGHAGAVYYEALNAAGTQETL